MSRRLAPCCRELPKTIRFDSGSEFTSHKRRRSTLVTFWRPCADRRDKPMIIPRSQVASTKASVRVNAVDYRVSTLGRGKRICPRSGGHVIDEPVGVRPGRIRADDQFVCRGGRGQSDPVDRGRASTRGTTASQRRWSCPCATAMSEKPSRRNWFCKRI